MAVDATPLVGHRRVAARRRRWLNRLGKALITIGVLLLLFVAWELVGTNFLAARSQAALRAELEAEGLPGYDIVEDRDAHPRPNTARPFVKPGDGIGYLRVPKIGVDKVFVEGIDRDALRKGPGHYEDTPLPGQKGNVGIAGHRTTYGAPFWALNRLRRGDRIAVETARGRFVYRVIWVKVVAPDDVWVLNPTRVRLSITLTTCTPRFSASQRLVVRAVQVLGPHPPGTRLAPQRIFGEPEDGA